MKKAILISLLLGTLFPAKTLSQDYMYYDEPDILFEFLFYLSLYPVIGYYNGEDHLYNCLTCYPYNIGKTGNYTAAEDAPEKYFRIDLENHILFNGNNAFGNHLDIKVRPLKYFYLRADFFYAGESNNATECLLWRSHSPFNIHLCYDRLRFQKFNLGWMAGISHEKNSEQKTGFSAGFNLDWFVLPPLSVHSSVNWGVASNIEIHAKYHIKRCFFAGGYDTLEALSVRHHFVSAGFGLYL